MHVRQESRNLGEKIKKWVRRVGGRGERVGCRGADCVMSNKD